jgi:predicted transcriptional regulator
MSDIQKYLNEQLKDDDFKKEWNNIQPELQIIDTLIEARKAKKITQKQLSELTGITQGDISKLENGSANPSIKTLQRLANALGMMLKIEFVPVK